jgi:hypothetical protein
LAKGETPAQAVTRLRIEMLALQQESARTRASPLPLQEQIAAVERFVAERGAYAGPRIAVQRDQLVLSWQDDVLADKQTLFGLLAWLAPATVTGALKKEIESRPSPVGAMPAAARIAKVAELEGKLLEFERKECALLTDEILPRAETDPRAFLGVAIAAKEAAAA